MAVLSNSWHCNGKGDLLLYGVPSALGCNLSYDSTPCCWGSGCTCPPHCFDTCPFLMPTKFRVTFIHALLVPAQMTTHCSGRNRHDNRDLSNCRSYFRSLVLSCVQVKHPGNIYWVLRYFHGPMGTVVGLSQVPLLAILNFWFFNPSPHSFSTYLLWDHLCFFLSLLPLFFPFIVCLSSFGILGGLVKPITQSRHIGNAMGPLCNDTSSKRSPTLQHFVAQRFTEQEDVSFNFNRIWQIHFLLSCPKICFISISWTVATHKEKFLHICSVNPDWVASSSLWQ